MNLQSTTIRDIVSEQMASVSLRLSGGGVMEFTRALRSAAQNIPVNDNGTTLEELGFKKIIPAFVTGNMRYGFVPNYNGDSFYTMEARPLKSGETLKATWTSALKGAGFGAMTVPLAGQAYIFSSVAGTFTGASVLAATGIMGVMAVSGSIKNLKAAYMNATVDTLGVGIRIHKDYEDYLSRRTSQQELLQSVSNSMQPVLYKA